MNIYPESCAQFGCFCRTIMKTASLLFHEQKADFAFLHKRKEKFVIFIFFNKIPTNWSHFYNFA